MQTNQSRATSSLWPGYPKRHYSSALILPGLGASQLRTTPITQSPLKKLLKLANPKLFSLSQRSFNKDSVLNPPLTPVFCLLTTLVLSHVAFMACSIFCLWDLLSGLYFVFSCTCLIILEKNTKYPPQNMYHYDTTPPNL